MGRVFILATFNIFWMALAVAYVLVANSEASFSAPIWDTLRAGAIGIIVLEVIILWIWQVLSPALYRRMYR